MTRRESPAEAAVARPPIRLRILGPIDLRDGEGRPVESVLAQPRRLGLLAYLALSSRHGFVRRDQALAMFWPEHDTEHARAALSRAIYYLRQALGDGAVVSRSADEIVVPPDRVWCDAVALHRALVDARFDEAVGLFRGELLAGFFVSGAAGFEQWAEDERRRFTSDASRAAWALAARATRAGDHIEAARLGQWAVDRSPLDEAGVRRLMETFDRAGDRAGAVMAYDRFARRLAGDLELVPAPETRALVEAIRARESAVVSRRGLAATPARAPIDVPRAETDRDDAALTASPRWRARRLVQRRVMVGGSITAVIAVVGIVALRRPPVSKPDPHRVAVVSLRTSRSDVLPDSLAERTASAIRDALVQTGLFAVILPLPSRAGSTVADLDVDRIAERSGAGFLVIASLRETRDSVSAEARIVETIDDHVRWVIRSAASRASEAAGPLGTVSQRVAGALAVLTDHRFASWLPVATTMPPTFAAFQEFDRATELKNRNRPGEALPHFEAATVLDPAFTWSMMEAAVGRMSIGDRPGADSVIDLVNARRDQLPSVQRFWLDWMLAVRDEDWVRSYAAIERAAELIPDRFLYGLAENARWLNRPRRSVELLDRLGPESQAGRGFGYWYLMADSYHQLGEHTKELDVARRARQRHPQRPTAVILEARARAALGDVAGAMALVDTILALPRDGRDTPGTLMLQTAEELRAHGHAAAGAALTDRAIHWFASQPSAELASLAMRRQFARAVYDAGRWSLADSLFRALVRDDRDGVADHRAMLGAIAAHRGNVAEARRWLSILRELTHSVHRPHEAAIFGQARIMAILGDAAESVRLLREALGGQGQDLHADADFAGLAADSVFRSFVRPKG